MSKFGDKITVYGKYRGVIISGIAAHPDVFPFRVAITDAVIQSKNGPVAEFFVRHNEFTEGWLNE